jgi:hypothetical protein
VKRLRRFIPVLLCLTVVAGCRRSQLVHYVLPDGYRGCFWVIRDPAAPALPTVGKGWLQVTVPANRVVLASSLSPLDSWHESTAVIGASFTAADLEVGKTIVSPGLVGVWIGPSGHIEPGGREYRSFFVGTEAEFVASRPEQFNPPQLR